MSSGKRRFLQNVAFWGVLLGLCYLGLRYALPCFLPLVVGALLASALHPAATRLCRRLGWRYRPCAVIVAVVSLTALGLLLWGVGGLLVRQGSALLPQLPRFFQETLLPLLEDLEEKWSSLLQRRDAAGWTGSLETVLQNAVSFAMDYREVFEIVDLAEIELACKGFDGFFFAHSEETQLEYRFCLS